MPDKVKILNHLFPGSSVHHAGKMVAFLEKARGQTVHSHSDTEVVNKYCFAGGVPEKIRSSLRSAGLDERELTVTSTPNTVIALLRYFYGIPKDERIVLHSGIHRHIWWVLLACPTILPRITWIDWAAGIRGPYLRWKSLAAKPLRERVLFHLWMIAFKKTIPRLGGLATLTPGEYDCLQELVGACDNRMELAYTVTENPPFRLHSIAPPGRPVRVLAGNSGHSNNRHLELFQFLTQFTHDNMELIVPLGYGSSPEYVERVHQQGRETFGDQFRPRLDLVPPEEYEQLLLDVDVLVMYSNWQHGLFNIRYVVSMGKKCFLCNESLVYDNFLRHQLRVFATDEIPNMSFQDFSSPLPESIQLENRRICDEELFSQQKRLSQWKDFFVSETPHGGTRRKARKRSAN